ILPIPTEQHGKVTYMCLIEDFYPNVINVIWEEGTKEVENAVHGKIWPSGDNKASYSVSSWLTIDKHRSANYHCTYRHEGNPKPVIVSNFHFLYNTKVKKNILFRIITLTTAVGPVPNAHEQLMLNTIEILFRYTVW
uniref:Ig-like domain-containing protein n=1 Tax=Pelusios castaneus TaxID=367368 RepID=A0A8C8SVK6_9SAUR